MAFRRTTSKRQKAHAKKPRISKKSRGKSKGFFFGGMGRDLQANPDGSY